MKFTKAVAVRLFCDAPRLGAQVRDMQRDAWLALWDSWRRQPSACAYRRVRPYTMCGYARLRGLYRAVQHAVRREVPGDLVECGVARGGSALLMGFALQALQTQRRLWLFDTFTGIPAPTRDNPDWNIARLYTGQCRGSLTDVAALLARFGLLEQCRLIPGLLQDTLPGCEARSIAVLHIDCDWYESVQACLEHLYDRVSPGGVIQLDDYGHWQGARKATDEFLQRRGLRLPAARLDYAGRQFMKPASASRHLG